MKYMIFLVNHHDGFCLYDTRLTDYKSTGSAAAWKHDVLKDVAAACREALLIAIGQRYNLRCRSISGTAFCCRGIFDGR
jgi:alpha-L-fucosidase